MVLPEKLLSLLAHRSLPTDTKLHILSEVVADSIDPDWRDQPPFGEPERELDSTDEVENKMPSEGDEEP